MNGTKAPAFAMRQVDKTWFYFNASTWQFPGSRIEAFVNGQSHTFMYSKDRDAGYIAFQQADDGDLEDALAQAVEEHKWLMRTIAHEAGRIPR